MARIRTIKPEFFTSADIVSLTPLARLFYVSLWCEADREGRLAWNPKTLKIRYFPVDDCSIFDLADELIGLNLIEIYEIDGKEYAEIPSFKQHQVINNRESESLIPSRVKDACKRVSGEGRKEGREGKGKEDIYTPDFEKFWEAYPKKQGKQPAAKSFSKVDVGVDVLLESIEQWKQSDSWRKGFIHDASTWLNQRRWEDQLEVTPKKNHSGYSDMRDYT